MSIWVPIREKTDWRCQVQNYRCGCVRNIAFSRKKCSMLSILFWKKILVSFRRAKYQVSPLPLLRYKKSICLVNPQVFFFKKILFPLIFHSGNCWWKIQLPFGGKCEQKESLVFFVPSGEEVKGMINIDRFFMFCHPYYSTENKGENLSHPQTKNF